VEKRVVERGMWLECRQGREHIAEWAGRERKAVDLVSGHTRVGDVPQAQRAPDENDDKRGGVPRIDGNRLSARHRGSIQNAISLARRSRDSYRGREYTEVGDRGQAVRSPEAF
jgi:hypothetical protein